MTRGRSIRAGRLRHYTRPAAQALARTPSTPNTSRTADCFGRAHVALLGLVPVDADGEVEANRLQQLIASRRSRPKATCAVLRSTSAPLPGAARLAGLSSPAISSAPREVAALHRNGTPLPPVSAPMGWIAVDVAMPGVTGAGGSRQYRAEAPRRDVPSGRSPSHRPPNSLTSISAAACSDGSRRPASAPMAQRTRELHSLALHLVRPCAPVDVDAWSSPAPAAPREPATARPAAQPSAAPCNDRRR